MSLMQKMHFERFAHAFATYTAVAKQINTAKTLNYQDADLVAKFMCQIYFQKMLK
jgi:hypothetical protein